MHYRLNLTILTPFDDATIWIPTENANRQPREVLEIECRKIIMCLCKILLGLLRKIAESLSAAERQQYYTVFWDVFNELKTYDAIPINYFTQ